MIPPSYRTGNVPDLDPGRVNCQTRAAALRARCMNFFRKFTKSRAHLPRGPDAPVLSRSTQQYAANVPLMIRIIDSRSRHEPWLHDAWVEWGYSCVCTTHTHSSTKFSKFRLHMLHIVDSCTVPLSRINKFKIRKQFVCYNRPTMTKISHWI